MIPKTTHIVLTVGVAASSLGSKALQRDPIGHGPPRGPGNSLPEGARSLCPEVPSDAAYIPQLKSGWAISASSTASIELLLSNQVLACRQLDSTGVSSQSQDTCTNAWAFTVSMPPELLRPGTYELTSWANRFMEWTATAVPSDGCNGGSCVSTASAGGGTSGGALEIIGINEACITGRFIGLQSSQWEPPVDYEGIFYAVRCSPDAH
jgi:hypothetical protein